MRSRADSWGASLTAKPGGHPSRSLHWPADDPERRSAALAKYRRKRDQTPFTATAQWDLAVWCDRQGLKPEATAHYSAVTRIDPSQGDAWRKLGYHLYRGVWMDAARIDAEKAEIKRQVAADRQWGPVFAKVRLQLAKPETRVEAERVIAGVDDPRSVPAAWRSLGTGGPALQLVAAQVFGQTTGPASSRALAALAAFGRSESVRRAAVEILARRDPREFDDLFIGLLRDRIQYVVKPVGGPGSPGALFVAGEQFNLQRVYQAPPLVSSGALGMPFMGFSPSGRPVILRVIEGAGSAAPFISINGLLGLTSIQQIDERTALLIAESTRVAASSEAHLEADVTEIEAINAEIQRMNTPADRLPRNDQRPALGADPEAWRRLVGR